MLKYAQETVQKKGEDWLKDNLETFLRQWQYVSSLL